MFDSTSVSVEEMSGTRLFRSHRVAVRDELVTLSLLSLLSRVLTREGELRYNLPERREGFVDVCTFFETLTSRPCRVSSL